MVASPSDRVRLERVHLGQLAEGFHELRVAGRFHGGTIELALNRAQVFGHAQDPDVDFVEVVFSSHGPRLLRDNDQLTISFTTDSEQMSHVHALS